ncbi:MAG: DUF721 domain-containing protein [Phaeodactylibacter sp.]|nr:DUF721 domain-containing protein [Phaeodactylibacter sp.]
MRQNNDESLKEVLHKLVEHYRWKGRLNQERIRAVWQERMGRTINDYTTDIRVFGQKLYISISSASLRQELSMEKSKIRDMMNEALGEAFLQEVIIR